MLPREFARLIEAYHRRLEREARQRWEVACFLRNHLVQAQSPKKIRPITPKDLMPRAAPPEGLGMTRDEWAAYCEHLDRVRDAGTRKLLN